MQEYLLQFTSGETQWVTEDEKWELKRDGRFFMDITEFRDLGSLHTMLVHKNKFPKAVAQKHKLFPLCEDLDSSKIKANLEQFTSFHNRYYISEHGAQSSKWLLDLVNSTITEAGADKYGVTVKPFEHEWPQHSIIVSIPGKTNSTIVVGGHQDSANYWDPINGRAPGADDDGSGTMTILEVLRVLLTSKDILEGKAENTIEFHWYAAEEAGLLGSQAIFREYESTSRDVKAMLQQDMTGFINRTVEAGRKPEFGLLMDMVEEDDLIEYMKLIIAEYTDISWVKTTCGHCGSDHMSAIKAGYPAIYVFESDFALANQHVHTPEDLIKHLDFSHMIDHARMTLGFVYELAFADL